jgi:hypothetical protein
MLNSLLHCAGTDSGSTDIDKFEPIYGLPKRSLDEWMSRNPKLKEEYEEELSVRLQRRRAAQDAKSRRPRWAMKFGY